MKKLIKVGITHGDFNGIGYEVILKVLAEAGIYDLMTPILYGSPQVLSYYRKLLGINLPCSINLIKSPEEATDGMLNIVATNETGIDLRVTPGEPSRYAGTMAARALYDARDHLLNKQIDVLVTAPIDKDTIQSTDFSYKGHTDFLAEPFPEDNPLMLFVAGDLRVALVTTHIALKDVATAITPELVLQKLRLLETTLVRDFEVIKPQIAVLSINPHMGENNLIGTEETTTLIPALKTAWEEGRYALGPVSPDGYWGSGMYHNFEATLAMYHDQGLIPFKLIAMNQGVNVTAGLPVVRTSPDHGTAYDIAGQGVANEESMRNAIYVAIDIFRCRMRYQEMSANPLQKKFVNTGKDNIKLDLSKSDDEDIL